MAAFDSWAPGQDDWAARWQVMYDAERAQGEAATHPDFQRHADHYQNIARRYAARTARVPQPDAFMRWLLPLLTPGATVLDIGAGTGRYVTPLLAAGHTVVAVEQSAAMRAQITAPDVAAATRLTIVAESWPQTTVTRCQVAFAAHVLYAVRDIVPFIHAMNSAATERCVLLLGARHPTTPILPLWAAYHGVRRLPLPAAYECIAVLAQLGIAADVTVLPPHEPMAYLSRADAIDDICYRLRLPWDDAHRTSVAHVLKNTWGISDDGPFIVPEPVPPNVIISWRTNTDNR